MEMSPSIEHMAVPLRSGNNKLQTIAVIIAVLLSVIAIVVALVSVGKTASIKINVSSASSSGCDNVEDKIWLLSIGNFGSYIDDATGEIMGFNVDLVNAVCEIANKDCRLLKDTTQRCWDSQAGSKARAGEGIMAGYYDACVGWFHTYDRNRTLRFSYPYTHPTSSVGFQTLAGNPGSFNWLNLTGSIIGFVDGTLADEHCVARVDRIQGNILSQSQIRHYANSKAMLEALNDGEIDAVFYSTRRIGADYSLVSDGVSECVIAGASVVTRKDNRLIDWWNPAFEKLKSSSQWRDICNDKTGVHGYLGPDCIV